MFRIRIGAALAALVLSATAVSAGELAVIVNPANPQATLDAKAVKSHFLKSVAAWANGEKVRPVDSSADAGARAAFVSKVLGMSPTDFERYWLEKQYASADNPPTKAPDDASVIKLVKAFKGGIGFVSKEAAAAAGADVKIVLTVAY
jgi:hypothetical protein